MALLKITREMREAAGKLLKRPPFKLSGADRALLTAMSDGKRKQIKAHWWAKFFKQIDQTKLDKLQALADPTRNTNVHERTVASSKLDHFKASRAPGMPPEAPPFPKELFRRSPRKRHAAKIGGVNTKRKRTGDRHRTKGDRHKPGYMRDYMRRRREKLRREAF